MRNRLMYCRAMMNKPEVSIYITVHNSMNIQEVTQTRLGPGESAQDSGFFLCNFQQCLRQDVLYYRI